MIINVAKFNNFDCA